MLKKTTDLEKRYIPNIQYTPTLEKRMAIHCLYTALDIALRQSHGPRVANCLGGHIFQYIPPLGSVLLPCFNSTTYRAVEVEGAAEASARVSYPPDWESAIKICSN